MTVQERIEQLRKLMQENKKNLAETRKWTEKL